MAYLFMFSLPLGGGHCFWCGSHRCRCSLLSALYLLNQWMDFDQTCTDTLLGEGKTVIRFWWPWPHFQGHTGTLKFFNFDQKSLSAPYLLNQMTDSGQTSYIVTLGCFKDFIRFWWPWGNFQGHYTIKTVQMSLVFTLSCEPIHGFWPNLYRNYWNMGKKWLDFGDLDLIFKVTPALWMSNFDKKACLHHISWTKWWILAKLYVLYHWDN